MKKICFVMANAYPVISDGGEQVGGAELQAWLIAKTLSKKFDVHFIVKGKEEGKETKNGVRIHKLKYINPVIGHLKILKKMFEVDADVYYQRTGGMGTIKIGLFCMFKNKKFAFHVSRDEQLDEGYPFNRNRFFSYLYDFAVGKASIIFIQNKIQGKKLLQKFGRKGMMLKNIIDPGCNFNEKKDFIVWVANISNPKKPLKYIFLARKLPQYRFVMIGNPADKDLFERVQKEASSLPNLDFLGFKPFHEADKYISEARVFVNTSEFEGFPNTFLQAWRCSTPVVSLNIDPDEIIDGYGLGFHSGSFENMVRDVQSLMEDKDLNKQLGHNGREYVKKNHDIKKLGKRLEKIFGEL